MKRFSSAVPSSLSLALALLAAPAIAQEAPAATAVSTDPDDVVVTARRREERLSDVPIAATVVDAQSLADRGGVLTTQDIVQNSPGVRFFNTTSQLNSEVSIRASGTARGTNADPSIGLYRNGMFVGGGYLGGRNFTRIDLFDLGRVEVLRGTQGALYGRDAVGGTVNMVSAQPEFRRTGFIDADYGFGIDSFRFQAVVNEALGEHVAARVGIEQFNQTKGSFYAPNFGTYFDQQNGTILRGQLRYKDGPVDINFLAEHEKAIVPTVAFRVFVRAGANANFPRAYAQDPYSYPWNFPPLGRQGVDSGIYTGNFDLGFATLSTTAGYRKRKSYFQYDTDGLDEATQTALEQQGLNTTARRNGTPNLSTSNDDTTRIWSYDMHLTGVKSGGLTWLLGLEIFDEKTNYEILTGTSAATPTPGNRTTGVQTYSSIAGYGSLGYDFTEQFNVTGELRYTQDRKSIVSAQYNRITGALGSAQFQLNDRITPSNLAYTATASYKPTQGWLLYAKIGTGYRSGGFNYNLGDPLQPVTIPPSYGNEISTTAEVGVKGNLSRGIAFTAAAYRTTVSNAIVGSQNGCSQGNPVCGSASVPFLLNAGNARSWGIEADLTARFQLAGGTARIKLAGSRQGGKITSGLYTNAPLPQVPDWIASASFNYRVPVSPKSSLFFNANYQGSFGGVNELTPAGTPFYQSASAGPFQSPIGDISLVDLRAGVTMGPVDLAVYARNALQYKYVVYEAISTQRLNPRRVVGVEAKFSW